MSVLASISSSFAILFLVVPANSVESLSCILNAEIIIHIHTFLCNLGELGSNVRKKQSILTISWLLSIPFIFDSYPLGKFFRIDPAVNRILFLLGAINFLWHSWTWCIFILEKYVSGVPRISSEDINCNAYILWGILFTIATSSANQLFFSGLSWEQCTTEYLCFRVYSSLVFVTLLSLANDRLLHEELFSAQA